MENNLNSLSKKLTLEYADSLGDQKLVFPACFYTTFGKHIDNNNSHLRKESKMTINFYKSSESDFFKFNKNICQY